MRWDRFFDDLEGQLASEWEAERAALDTEAERLRLSRVILRERLSALIGRSRETPAPSFEVADGTVLAAEVTGVGADWAALEGGRSGALIVPFGAITAIGMPHADVLRSARPAAGPVSLAERMTLGFVLRDLVRRRVCIRAHLVHGRMLAGTIDRAGADHFDIALHEPGTPRRATDVTGHRLVPFSALAWIRLDAGAALS
ncbi:hypothetical protein NQ152_14185 [Microbacterium sp. zg.B48]|uniref:hypothetical protein n=1 Tax=unclassified Microbacterium TaxID=2609290 RepID=UPI00214D03D4|nr:MULTISPECIES: hypothetical protein [unclassified Microbacterium]MCR2764657.1 hypothetical protein [Microbacterium sp. zg.B48]MCR2810206.1 hypothetical protein [Microbacterium sp. zg.B185]WIM19962.1 hypothetical protein QNO12_03910 [Microbacterium sp. zg-B185]